MLRTNKNITLTGQSIIEIDDEENIVATMTAIISENGAFSENNNIIDTSLYKSHKSEVRADMRAFSDMAYELSEECSTEEEEA